MIDLKFPDLKDDRSRYTSIVDTVRTPEIRDVALAFIGNADKMYVPLTLPVYFIPFTVLLGTTIEQHLDAIVGEGNRRELSPDEFARLEALLGETWTPRKLPRELMRQFFQPELFRAFLRSIEGSPGIAERFRAAIEDAYASMIVDAWTAFETLANDLWIEAALLYPASIPSIAGKSLNRDGLGKFAKVNMRNFVAIQTQYNDFGVAATQFGDPGLCVLFGARNVLVHKAGIIDQVFLKRVSDNPIAYQHFNLHALSVKDELPLDGEFAVNLTRAVIDFGTTIIPFVDQWCASKVPPSAP